VTLNAEDIFGRLDQCTLEKHMNTNKDTSSKTGSKANVVHHAPQVASATRNAALKSFDCFAAASVLSVDNLMQVAFFNGRAPRSAEYKAGTRMALEHRIERKDIVPPYETGTAVADAFFAGIDEGKLLYRVAMEKIGGAA
jgi:hypothetical protein